MGHKSLLFVLLMALTIPAVWAQTAEIAAQNDPSQPASDEPVATIRASVQEVNVIFTATDRRGHYLKDLKSNDLAVYDDGKPPARVNSFVSETDLPLRVGLVMDVSGSITDRMAFEQESAIKFFNQILRPHTDQAFVLAFDSVQRMPQDFTDDPVKLANGVRSLTPGGGTALYDAIATAASKRLHAVKSERPLRRVIILISDGEDNQSRTTRAEAIDAARRAEVTVYAISTNDSNVRTRGDKMLEQLAEETGGRAFFPNKVEDVAHAFGTIQDELRSQYAVSYKPADFSADGRYRSIQIVARSDKNVVIRARKGYFAPSR
ncbi:MAG TPA: VWA domain-containing protein [Terriglobales bacterium]